MIQAYDARGVKLLRWSMTETTSLATVGADSPEIAALPLSGQYKARAMQGIHLPFLEIRARSSTGLVQWDRNGRRARSAKSNRGLCVLQSTRGCRRLHRRRMVSDGRYRQHRSTRMYAGPRPRQGSDQVRRRVDQLYRAIKYVDGSSGGGGSSGHCGRRRQMGGSAPWL